MNSTGAKAETLENWQIVQTYISMLTEHRTSNADEAIALTALGQIFEKARRFDLIQSMLLMDLEIR